MTKRSHNKKRNVGIIYEQLVYKLSKALVENDKKTFADTKSILKKYFKKGTELYKEYRLVNSLVSVQITEPSVIPAILEETNLKDTYSLLYANLSYVNLSNSDLSNIDLSLRMHRNRFHFLRSLYIPIHHLMFHNEA